MSTHAIPLAGKCPHMPIFIGCKCPVGGGHMSVHQATQVFALGMVCGISYSLACTHLSGLES